MNGMVNHVQTTRPRFVMKINEDNQHFYLREVYEQRWIPFGNATYAGHGLVVESIAQGARLNISSVCGKHQTILVADWCTNMVIGRIEVNVEGSLAFFDGPHLISVQAKLPWFWHNTVSLIVGLPCPSSINIRDIASADEDIFRYKAGNKRWFVPERYRTPTRAYDVDFFDQQAARSTTGNQPLPSTSREGEANEPVGNEPAVATVEPAAGEEADPVVPTNERADENAMALPAAQGNDEKSFHSSSFNDDDRDVIVDFQEVVQMPGLVKREAKPADEQ